MPSGRNTKRKILQEQEAWNGDGYLLRLFVVVLVSEEQKQQTTAEESKNSYKNLVQGMYRKYRIRDSWLLGNQQ